MRVIARILMPAGPALLGLALAHAGDDPLLRLFPTAHDVPGLEATDDGRHASGEDLTLIYDGGYQRYLDAGVTGVSQRLYRAAGGSVELTLHQMKSPEAGEHFMASLCKDIKASVETRSFGKAKGHTCMTLGQGTAYGYLALGTLLATASFDQGDATVPAALLQAVAKRAAAPVPKRRR